MKNFRETFEIKKEEVKFSLKLPASKIVKFMVDDNGDTWVDLVKKGTYYYYGEVIEIGDTEFNQAIKNFRDGLTNEGTKKDLLFDYDHDYQYTKAAGWINNLRISEDGNTLLGKVDWSKSGKESIEGDEYRYTSLEFSLFYYVKELVNGEHVEIDRGFTVFACTLTNRPFVSGMEKVTLSEKNNIAKSKKVTDNKKVDKKEPIGGSMNFEEEYNKGIVKLSETNKNLETANKSLTEVQAENEKLKGEISLSKKNSDFDAMLAKGTTVEAQREHFLSGDMVKFSEAFVVLPKEEAGTSDEPAGDEKVNFSKLATELATKENITFAEAIKIVKRENKGDK